MNRIPMEKNRKTSVYLLIIVMIMCFLGIIALDSFHIHERGAKGCLTRECVICLLLRCFAGIGVSSFQIIFLVFAFFLEIPGFTDSYRFSPYPLPESRAPPGRPSRAH